MRFFPRLPLTMTASVLASGCTVGPNYVQPETPMPEAWTAAAEEGLRLEPAVLSRWWSTLGDPQLDALIVRAVESNLDLRVAEARVREARALRGAAAAEGLPQVDLNGSYTRLRRSENSGRFTSSGGDSASASAVSISSDRDSDLYQAGFDAGWEIDIFGRVRRSVEAAEADIDAANERTRDVLVSLLAEVARNYVDVRGFQQRVAIAQSNITSQQEAVDLTKRRFEVGLTSELDVAQARTLLAATQSRVPALETALKQAMHRLGVLLGRHPGALVAELSPEGPIPDVPPDVAVGMPSDLLRRRPDVRAAERDLAAANARIGAATAELFPRFSLFGSIGLASDKPADFFSASSIFWSVGPSVTWPVFDAGRIRANIEVQDARTEQALAIYEQAVLKSLEEAENALVAYAKEQVRRRLLAEAVDASQRAVDISNQLYTRGLVAFLNVIEAQRALYLSQDELVESDRSVAANLIALYKALGGGWETEELVARE